MSTSKGLGQGSCERYHGLRSAAPGLQCFNIKIFTFYILSGYNLCQFFNCPCHKPVFSLSSYDYKASRGAQLCAPTGLGTTIPLSHLSGNLSPYVLIVKSVPFLHTNSIITILNNGYEIFGIFYF